MDLRVPYLPCWSSPREPRKPGALLFFILIQLRSKILAQSTRSKLPKSLSIFRGAAHFAQLVRTSQVKLSVISVRNKHKLHPNTTEVQDPGPIYKEQIAKIPVHLERGSPFCSTCENFTSEAVSYLSEKQTQEKIMEILHDACSETFSLEQKCVELVDSYATLLFTEITKIKPDEFCKQYGLCKDIAFLSGTVSGNSTCKCCHHLVDEVFSKLKDPDAEFEIIQFLLKECKCATRLKAMSRT